MRTYYQERRALGCRVQLALVMSNDSMAETLMKRLWLEVLYFEKRCSRFLPDSELSQLNRSAGQRQFISPELSDVLRAAATMARKTDGLYNPFILPAVQRAGYVHSLVPSHQHDAVDDFASRQVVPADRLQIGDDWASIPYGTAVDLGGCGKGYIGDQLGMVAQDAEEVDGFWFSIGGDVIVGGCDEQGKAWTVFLQPDPDGDQRIGEIVVPVGESASVATSTTRYRRGKKEGKAWHHIIDPRTGLAADGGIDLASVYSSSLLVADVLATCVIIAGVAGAEALVASQPEVNAVAWQRSSRSTLNVRGEGIIAYDAPQRARNAANTV